MAETLQDQQRQIEEALSQAQLSRKQLEEQKRQVEQARLNITQPRKRVPFTSRQQREEQRRYLREDIPKFRKQIGEAETGLSQYESQLMTGKQEIARVAAEQQAFERAKKLAIKAAYDDNPGNILLSAYFGLKQKGYNDAYQYFLDLYRYHKDKQKQSIQPEVQDYYVQNPKYKVDGDKIFLDGKEIFYTPADLYKTINYSPYVPPPVMPEVPDITFEQAIRQQSIAPSVYADIQQRKQPQTQVKATVVDVPVYDQYGKFVRNERAIVKESDVKKDFLSKLASAKYNSPKYKSFLKQTEDLRAIPAGFAGLITTPLNPVYDKIFETGRMSDRTDMKAKVYRGGLAAGKFAALESNPVTGIPTTAYYGAKALELTFKDPAGFFSGLLTGAKEEPFELGGALFGAGLVRSGTGQARTSIQPKSGLVSKASLSRDVAREGFVRPRATIVIKDSQGRYLLGVDKNSGNYITLGGGIEKGQTSKQALLAELKQETGLSLSDVSSYKLRDRLTTPRDDYFVYEVKLKPGAEKRIVPSSDVAGIKWIKPSRGYTGPTPSNPLGQPTILGFAGRRIRPEDAYLISRTEELIKIDSSLSRLSKEAKDKLLLEARNRLGREFGANKLEGITNNQLLRDYLLYKKKLLPTQLYFKSSMGELLLSPTSRYSIPTKQQAKFTQGRITKQTYKTKKLVSRLQINDFLTPNYNTFKLTKRMGKRTYQRSELLTTLTPQRIGADSLSSFLTGKRKVFGEKTVRGETPGIYVSPPISPGSKTGYAGLVYLFGGPESGLGLGFRSYKTPQIYTLKAKIRGEIYKKGFTLEQLQQYARFRTGPVAAFYKSMEGKGVVPTPKSFGRELEAVITPGTVFKVSGRKKTFYLAGRKIQQREIRLAKVNKKTANKVSENLKIINNPYSSKGEYNQAVRELKQTTGIDYSSPSKRRIEVTPNLNSNLIRERAITRRRELKERPKANTFESMLTIERKMKAPKEQPRIKQKTFEGRLPPERRFKEIIIGEPRKVKPPETTIREPPRKTFNLLMPKRREQQRRRQIARREVRKRNKFGVLPTVFELITYGRAKSKKAKRRITGFESMRFI